MIQVAVIADDLTGANATGVQLVKNELRVDTITSLDNLEGIKDCDCIIYSTDSRAINSESAYERVYDAAQRLKNSNVKLYSKRIDSTLRGNIGSETDAILDALGDEYIALAVPCFPQAGRINVGGHLLVNAIPLHRTEAAVDPKNSIKSSVCEEIFAEQSKYLTASVLIGEVSRQIDYLAMQIVKLKEQGVKIIIFDAVTTEDLDRIAEAAVVSKINFVAIDPGVFTAAVCRQIITPAESAKQPIEKRKKVLAVVGSVNAVAASQVENFLQTQRNYNVFVDTDKIVENEAVREGEIARVVKELLEGSEEYEVASIVGTGIYPQNRIDIGKSVEDISSCINEAFAEIVYKILSANSAFCGLYTCGGDISVAVCNRLGAYGMRLHNEVVPLASYGELKGGQFAGLKYITKGGMVGDENALVTCVNYLKSEV